MQQLLDSSVKRLGFGLMRLPTMEQDKIDIEAVKGMVDTFLARGFTYFDTAYFYHDEQSEPAIRAALVDRYPRESFLLATKLPVYAVKEKADMQRFFDNQLARTGAGYFDFYLLHSLLQKNIAIADEYGAWDFVKEMKAQGKIRHWGFSFHDSPETLDRLLTEHPDVEFVQLQINYADWENPEVQSRRCYEVATSHGVPVIVMEPVKGGSLAQLPDEIAAPLLAMDKDASLASWAIRWCASLDNVMMVLSGMSNQEQLLDNINTMQAFTPVTAAEQSAILAAREAIEKMPQVACTKCKYCMEECPQHIAIPRMISIWNKYLRFRNRGEVTWMYGDLTENTPKASECLACGACEGRCPQHLPIIDTLRSVSELLD